MFESLYRYLLITAFGQFIENFDEKIIEVKKWDGKFIAENLIIKKNALNFISEKIGIPLVVKYGLIKKIELEVEWGKFLMSNSFLKLYDVHLLCTPGHEYDAKFKNKIKSKLKNDNIEKKFKHICESFLNEKLNEIKNFSPNLNWRQISLLDYKNTDKNGMENFMDHETKIKIGKSFNVVDINKFAVYFNSSNKKFFEDKIFKLKVNIEDDNNNSVNKDRNKDDNKNSLHGKNPNEINSKMENTSTNFSKILNTENIENRDNLNNNLFSSHLKINFFNKTNNISKSSNVSYSSAKSFLPQEYEEYYDFSSKIFNIYSYEYSNQNFIIEPTDMNFKLRKNTNPQMNNDLPLSSILFENNNDLTIILNEGILNDLIYLINLRNYHINQFNIYNANYLFELKNLNLEELLKKKDNFLKILKDNFKEFKSFSDIFKLFESKIKLEEGIGIKKTFLKENYTKSQKNVLFKAAIEKILEMKNKNKFRKDIFLNKLYLIQKYKKMYYLILLNQHEYTQVKLTKDNLKSFTLENKKFIYEDLNEIHANIIDIQMQLDDKLILWLRLNTLLKFKDYLENLISNEKINENKSFFNYFTIDLSKLNIFKNKEEKKKEIESGKKTKDSITEAELNAENYDLIAKIIESDNFEAEKINKENNKRKFLEKKTLSFLTYKFENLNFIFQEVQRNANADYEYSSAFNMEKKNDLFKVSFQKILIQTYESTRSKKNVIIFDDLNISDMTLPNSKFVYIFTKTKMFRYVDNYQNLEIKSFYDDLEYDQDGFIQKITQNELNLIRHHFFKMLFKTYLNHSIKTNLVCDVKDFDVFLNFPFYKSLIRIFLSLEKENNFLNLKLLELEKFFEYKEEILFKQINDLIETSKYFLFEQKNKIKNIKLISKTELIKDVKLEKKNDLITSKLNILEEEFNKENFVNFETFEKIENMDLIQINEGENFLLQSILKDYDINKLSKQINGLNIQEIKLSKIRIFLLNNYYAEDYKSFVVEFNKINTDIKQLNNNFSIENIRCFHTDNFLISISANSNERTKTFNVFQNFKLKIKSEIVNSKIHKIHIDIPNDFIFNINKNILYLLFEYKSSMLSFFIDLINNKLFSNSDFLNYLNSDKEDSYINDSYSRPKFVKDIKEKLKALINLCKNRETNEHSKIIKENFIKQYLIEMQKKVKKRTRNEDNYDNEFKPESKDDLKELDLKDGYEVANENSKKEYLVKNSEFSNTLKNNIGDELEFNILNKTNTRLQLNIFESEVYIQTKKLLVLIDEYSDNIENFYNVNMVNKSINLEEVNVNKKMFYILIDSFYLRKQSNILLGENDFDFEISNFSIGIINPTYHSEDNSVINNNNKIVYLLEKIFKTNEENININVKIKENYTLDIDQGENISNVKNKYLNLKRKTEVNAKVNILNYNIIGKNINLFFQDLNKYLDDLNFLIEKNILSKIIDNLTINKTNKKSFDYRAIYDKGENYNNLTFTNNSSITHDKNCFYSFNLLSKVETLFHKIKKSLIKNKIFEKTKIKENLENSYKNSVDNSHIIEIEENKKLNEELSNMLHENNQQSIIMNENNFDVNNKLSINKNNVKIINKSSNNHINDLYLNIDLNIKNLKFYYSDLNEDKDKFIFENQPTSAIIGNKRYESILNRNKLLKNKEDNEKYNKLNKKYIVFNISKMFKFQRIFLKKINYLNPIDSIHEEKTLLNLILNQFEVKNAYENFLLKIDESYELNDLKDEFSGKSKNLLELNIDKKKNINKIDIRNILLQIDNSNIAVFKELLEFSEIIKDRINVINNSINEIKAKIKNIAIKIFLKNARDKNLYPIKNIDNLIIRNPNTLINIDSIKFSLQLFENSLVNLSLNYIEFQKGTKKNFLGDLNNNSNFMYKNDQNEYLRTKSKNILLAKENITRDNLYNESNIINQNIKNNLINNENDTLENLSLSIETFTLDLKSKKAKAPNLEKTIFLEINSINFTNYTDNILKIDKGIQIKINYYNVLVLRDIHKFYMNIQKTFDLKTYQKKKDLNINNNINKTLDEKNSLEGNFNQNFLDNENIEVENSPFNKVIIEEQKIQSPNLNSIIKVNFIEIILNDFFLKEKFNEITINPSNNIKLLIEEFYFSKISNNPMLNNSKTINYDKQNNNNNIKIKENNEYSVYFSCYTFLADEKIFQVSKNKSTQSSNLFSSSNNINYFKANNCLGEEKGFDSINNNFRENYNFEKENINNEDENNHHLNNYICNVNFNYKPGELIIDIPLIKFILSEKIFGILKLLKNYTRVTNHYFKELKIKSKKNPNSNDKPIELVLEFLNLNFFKINIGEIILKFKETVNTQINSDFDLDNSNLLNTKIKNFNKENKVSKDKPTDTYFNIKELDEEYNLKLSEKHKIKNDNCINNEKVFNDYADLEAKGENKIELVEDCEANKDIINNNEITNLNENLHLIEFEQNFYIKFSFEFFFNNHKKIDYQNKIINKLDDFSLNLTNIQAYFFNKIKTKFSNFLDEKNYLVYPFDINVDSNEEIFINLSNIEFDFSIRKISLLKRILNQTKENYLKSKNENLLKNPKVSTGKFTSNYNTSNKFNKKKSKFDDDVDEEYNNSNKKSFSISKREILKRAFLDYRTINIASKNFSIIISKEDSINSKIFEPLFTITLKKTKIKLLNSETSIESNFKVEFFNSLNLYWEPLLEKTNFSLKIINTSLNLNETFLNFDKGININFAIQMIKNLQTILEDKNNIDKYSNIEEIAQNFVNLNFNNDGNEGNNLNNFLNTINNNPVLNTTNNNINYIGLPNVQDPSCNFNSSLNFANFNNTNNNKTNLLHMKSNKSFSNLNQSEIYEKPVKKTFCLNSSFSRFDNDFYSKKQFRLNNNYIENLLLKKSYYFQIENLIGDDLLLIIDEKSVIKISNKQTIPIEKVFVKNENMKNSFIRNNDSMISLRSINSFGSDNTMDRYKFNRLKKFSQKNQKFYKVDKIQNLNFQIQNIRKTFSVNLHKNFQEVEIIEKNRKANKLIVNSYIDYNGRKVLSFKTNYKIINKLNNIPIEINLLRKSELNSMNIGNASASELSLQTIIVPPLGETYIPFRYLDFLSFKIRPFLEEMNFYQPYSFSETIDKDSILLKDGIILKIQDAKFDKNNIFDDMYFCVNSQIAKKEFYDEQQLIIDYNIEIQNYMPHKILLFFNEEIENENFSTVKLNQINERFEYDINYLKDNLIYLDSFSSLKLNAINIELTDYNIPLKSNKKPKNKLMNIINLKEKKFAELILEKFNIPNNKSNKYNEKENIEINEINQKNISLKNQNILSINLDKLKNKHYQLIQIKSPKNDCGYDKCMVKLDMQLINKKIIFRFYVDLILVNQLDENINIEIKRNIRKITKNLDESEVNNLNLKNIENHSLESLTEYYKLLNSFKSNYTANYSDDCLLKDEENNKKENENLNLPVEKLNSLDKLSNNNSNNNIINQFSAKDQIKQSENKLDDKKSKDISLKEQEGKYRKLSTLKGSLNPTNTYLNSNLEYKTISSKQIKSRAQRKLSNDTDVISITNKTKSTENGEMEIIDNNYEIFQLIQKRANNSIKMIDFNKLSKGLIKFLELDKILNNEFLTNNLEKSKYNYRSESNVNLYENLKSREKTLNQLMIKDKQRFNPQWIQDIYLNKIIKTQDVKIYPYIKNNKLNKKIYRENILEENCFLNKRSNWIISSEFICLFEDDKFFIKLEDSEKEELTIFNKNDQFYQDYSVTIQNNKFLNEIIFSLKFLQEFSNENNSQSNFLNKENLNYTKYNFANRSANLIYDNVYIDKNKLKTISKTLINDFKETNLINFSKNISTKIILIREKYYFFNKTNYNIVITQDKCFDLGHYIIYPGGYTTFKWNNNDFPQILKIRIGESYFSNTFKIDTIGEFYINIKINSNTMMKNMIIKVFIIEKQGRIITSFEDVTEEPPIIFMNKTNKIFKFEEINKSNFSLFSHNIIKNDILIYPFSTIPFSMDDLIMNNLLVKINNIGYEYQMNEENFIEYSKFNIIEIEERKKIFQNFLIVKDKTHNYINGLDSERDFNKSVSNIQINNKSDHQNDFIDFLDLFKKNDIYILFKIYKNESMNHVIEIIEINSKEKNKIEDFILNKRNKLKAKNKKPIQNTKSPVSSKTSNIKSFNSNFSQNSPFDFKNNFINNNLTTVKSNTNLNSIEVFPDNSNYNVLNSINTNIEKKSNIIYNKLNNTEKVHKYSKNRNHELDNESNKNSFINQNQEEREKQFLNNSQSLNSNNVNENKYENEYNQLFKLNTDSFIKNKWNYQNFNQYNNSGIESFKKEEADKEDFSPNNKFGKNLTTNENISSRGNTRSSNSLKDNLNEFDDIILYISEYNLGNKIKKNKFYLNFSFIGISILDQDPKELAYMHLKNFNVNFSNSNKNIYKISLSISNFQIDNSIEKSIFPILLKTNKLPNKKEEKENFITFKTRFNYNKNGNVIYIDNLDIDLKNKIIFYGDGLSFIEFARYAKNLIKVFERNDSNLDNNLIVKGNINKKVSNTRFGNNKIDYDKLQKKDDLRELDFYNDFLDSIGNTNNHLNLNFISDLELDMINDLSMNQKNLNFICSYANKYEEEFLPLKENNESKSKLKILVNKIHLSQISFEVTIKPTQSLIHKFSNPVR